MVTIAQLAEHLVVAQEVVGSSPIGHPYTLIGRPDAVVSGRFCFAGDRGHPEDAEGRSA